MAGELRNFDPSSWTVTWELAGGLGSLDLTQGMIDGPGALTEAKDNPRWTRRGDRQSNYIRNRRPARGGTLTATYVAEAEIQDQLSALADTDEATGTIVGDIVVKDNYGSTVLTYRSAFIEDDPNLVMGDTAGDRPYVFGYAERVGLMGGARVAGT